MAQHLVRMHPERLSGEVFLACTTGRRLKGRLRTRLRDYCIFFDWPGNTLGFPQVNKEIAFTGAAAPMTQSWISGKRRMNASCFDIVLTEQAFYGQSC